MSLIKRGEGVLTIENTGTNTFSGGTTIMAGTLNLNAVQGLGTGTVTLNGGELVLNTAGTTEGTLGLVAANKIGFGGAPSHMERGPRRIFPVLLIQPPARMPSE